MHTRKPNQIVCVRSTDSLVSELTCRPHSFAYYFLMMDHAGGFKSYIWLCTLTRIVWLRSFYYDFISRSIGDLIGSFISFNWGFWWKLKKKIKKNKRTLLKNYETAIRNHSESWRVKLKHLRRGSFSNAFPTTCLIFSRTPNKMATENP